MKKHADKLFEIIIIFISSLVPFFWLRNGEIILGHDSGFRFLPVHHLSKLIYSWNDLSNFGYDWSIFKGFLMIQLPEAIFITIFGSIHLGQLATFIFWFFIMGLSMYILLKSFFPDRKYRLTRLFTSIFYMYNFYVLQGWFIAERGKFSLYSALPLAFLLFYKCLDRQLSLWIGVIFFPILLFFLNGGGNPPLFGSIFLVLGLVGIFYFLRAVKNKNAADITHIIKVISFFVITTILLNSYWVLPQYQLITTSYIDKIQTTGGIEGLLGWERVISENTSFINLFRLQGIPDWYNNPNHTYSNEFIKEPLLILASLIPFTIICLGLFFYSKSREEKNPVVKIIYLIFLFSLLLTAGTHRPLGILYEMFMRYIPGFAIFRSSYYKFGAAYIFSFTILTGYFLTYILERLFKGKKILEVIIISSLVFIFLYHFPFFSRNFFQFNINFSTKVTTPSYVGEMFNYINNFSKNEKVLLLPQLEQPILNDAYIWKFWSLDLLPRLGLTVPVVANDTNNQFVQKLYKAIYAGDEVTVSRLLQFLGIKTVLFRNDVINNDGLSTGKNLTTLKNRFHSLSALSLDKKVGEWSFYKTNLPTLPILRAASNITCINQYELEDIPSQVIASGSFLDNVYLFNNCEYEDKYLRAMQKTEVIQAECVLCDLDKITKDANQLTMSPIKLLPWSKFYFVVRNKESNLFNKQGISNGQKIDALIHIANTRLVEMWRMYYKDFHLKRNTYIAENIVEYKKTLKMASQYVSKLENKEKNNYILRLLTYLTFHENYIRKEFSSDLNGEGVSEILTFISSEKESLINLSWVSRGNTEKRYYIDITESAEYRIIVDDIENESASIKIDDKSVSIDKNLLLSKGVHKVEVILSPSRALNTLNSFVMVDDEKSNQYITRDIDDTKDYYLSFEYKLSSSLGAYILEEKNSIYPHNAVLKPAVSENFERDGKWHKIEVIYRPYSGVNSGTLSFRKNQEGSLEIKNIIFEEVKKPKIYFFRESEENMIDIPLVEYEKINPTKYIASIKKSRSPFILTFDQKFSPNWELRHQETMSSSSLAHFQVNGGNNGWYVDKSGDYDLIIEYTPQRAYITGLVVTAMTAVLLILFGIYNWRKHDK